MACLAGLALFAAVLLAASAEPVFRGAVLSESGGVAGARVRIKAAPHLTMTDNDGRFELKGQGERITTWKQGFFIGGVAAREGPLRIDLRPLPREDNPDYQWVSPQPSEVDAHNCGNCHRQIHDEWAGSAHAKAGRNRRFINLYDGSDWHGRPDRGWSLLKDHPNGAAVCVACHAPTVPFDDPGFDDFRKLSGVHARGIHCDYCHKIADVSIDKVGLEHGRYAYELLRPAKGQLFFGPLDDVDRDEDAYSPLYHESRYCASCHEGTIFGTKVYTTYSEWLESPARKQGKQCQTCHMTPTGKMANIAPGHGGVPRDPMTLASHGMAGASADMLRSCLQIHIVLSEKQGSVQVNADISVTNVGHRVPTGFIDRHLLIVVEALSGKNERRPLEDGPILPASAGVGRGDGDLAGRPGKLFGRQLVGADGKTPTPFWRANQEQTDTRLVPDKPERLDWRFASKGSATIRVRLIYRRFHKEVADAKGWPDSEIVLIDESLKIPAPNERRTWNWPDTRPKSQSP